MSVLVPQAEVCFLYYIKIYIIILFLLDIIYYIGFPLLDGAIKQVDITCFFVVRKKLKKVKKV